MGIEKHEHKREEMRDKKKEHSHYIPLFLALGLAFSCFMLLFLMLDVAEDATYYASPSGGGNGSSPSMPFQIEDFWSVAKPGDTLILLDGTFTGSRSMINPKVNGTASSPITIKALNDGQAIIDGQGARGPVYVPKSYIILEGFRAQNSDKTVVRVRGGTGNVLRRISAYNGNYHGNHHVIVISNSAHVLVEDCIASSITGGRDCYLVYESHHVTLRRCWCKWVKHSYGPHWGQIYASQHCIVENCVGTTDSTTPKELMGLANWCAEWNAPDKTASYNKYLGNIIYNFPDWGLTVTSKGDRQMTGNRYADCVVMDCKTNVWLRDDSDVRLTNMTIVNPLISGILVTPRLVTNADLRNSVILGGGIGTGIEKWSGATFTHSYNDIYGFSKPYSGTSKGTGELSVKPDYNTAKYGQGAYLIRPSNLKGLGEGGADIGAEVLYQYEDGVLTDKRLWPWPMEDRIFKETGVSVTWESHGGLWKTLDGVYEAEATGTIAPYLYIKRN